jgi:hypothetical protein
LAIETIKKNVRDRYLEAYRAPARPAKRFVHAKAHGLLRAEFEVLDSLPDQLRVGLFSEPKIYPAWIRFSNGAPQVQHDLFPDVRGMAIKLLQPESSEPNGQPLGQDFVLASHPVFFVRNACDFADLTKRMTGLGLPLSFFFPLNPLKWRWREMRIVFQSSFSWTSSVFGLKYWSQSPFKHGSQAVKFSTRPLRSINKKFSLRSNYLRRDITKRLKEEITFEFGAQIQTSPDQMPIEDATVVWSERIAPFHKIALLRIPPQNFNTPERLALEEQTSFAPWHTLPEHAPLGGINRVRKSLYDVMAGIRNTMNSNRASHSQPLEKSRIPGDRTNDCDSY